MRRLTVVLCCVAAMPLVAPVPCSATSPGRNGRIFFTQQLGEWESIFSITPSGQARRQVTATAGQDGSGAARSVSVSPRGTRIAYLASAPGGTVLMTADPDGSAPERVPLPFGDLYPDRPAWSLDGRTLIFTRDSSDGIDDGHPREIYRVNRDGSGLRVLALGAESPSWSPRGHGRVAFAQGGHCFSIWTMTPTGASKRRVLEAKPPAHEHCHNFFTDIDWSPDGSRIAFTGPKLGIWTSELTGRHVRKLSRTGVAPVWSPDGRRIAWTTLHLRDGRVVSSRLTIATPRGRVVRRIAGAEIDSWQSKR